MILSDDAVRQYHADGYYLARGFFDAQEIDLLKRSAKEDNELDKRSFGRADGEGGIVRLSLWNHPGDGIYGMPYWWMAGPSSQCCAPRHYSRT